MLNLPGGFNLANILTILTMIGGMTFWYFGNSSAVETRLYRVEYNLGILEQRVIQSDRAAQADRETARNDRAVTDTRYDSITNKLSELRILVAERIGKR